MPKLAAGYAAVTLLGSMTNFTTAPWGTGSHRPSGFHSWPQAAQTSIGGQALQGSESHPSEDGTFRLPLDRIFRCP